MAAPSLVDVLIIGGGPAGLAVATGLARQLYTAIVFDSGVYRNARATHMHNVPTWDHRDPAEYRSKARDDLLGRYSTIRFESARIETVRKPSPRGGGGHFEAVDAAGTTWTGRKLMLATGVTDVYPDIDGYDDCWARGIFHCLFCHGYEDRGDGSVGVLAVDDLGNAGVALHLARMAKRLAPQVNIYTHGAEDLGLEIVKGLGDRAEGFHIDPRRITRLEKLPEGSAVVVHLADGSQITEMFMTHKPKTQVNGPFVSQLGLELTDQGDIKTLPPFYESASVPGLFAVGDCATPLKAVSQAAAMGAFGAAGLAAQLAVDDPPVVQEDGPSESDLMS